MKPTKITTIMQIVLITGAILFFQSECINAQAWKKLKEKASSKVSNKLNKNKKTSENTSSSNTPNQSNQTENTSTNSTNQEAKNKVELKKSLLEDIKAEQEKLKAENKITTANFSKGAYQDANIPAYLSFTNDYKDKEANMSSFSGNDYIYAKLNIDNVLTDILPKEDAPGLQYYRVKVIVKAGSGYKGESNIKINKREKFKYPYSKKDLMIAIVPQKEFYESIKTGYIEAKKTLREAYDDILSRNFGSGISYNLQYLPVGEHRVEVNFEVTAKLRSDQFYELRNIKGVFMLTVDENTRNRYNNCSNDIKAFYQQYKQEDEKLYAEEHAEDYEKMRKEIMDNYDPNENSSSSDFKFTIHIKNNNTGQSIRIIQKNVSRGSENLHLIPPGKKITLELSKQQKWTILKYGQNASKDSAVKVADVNQSNDGQTLNVK